MTLLNSLMAILNEMSPYILLGFLIAGILHVFIKPSVMSRHLSGNGFGPVVKAALFGIPLPLCSCGVLPTAVSLKRGGASSAASTSFLIATPQTGVDSIAATYSLLGPAMAIVRPVAALVGAVFGGMAVGRFAHDAELAADGHDHDGASCPDCNTTPDEYSGRSFLHKVIASVRYGFVDMIQHVGKWLVIGLVIAALITVFVPDDLFVSLSRYPLLAMLAMVAVAVPMYICATGSIPIALSLMLKGLSPGVAFVMLMAGPAANFASVMVLRRSMGTRATAIYIGSVVVTAISIGLIIDYLLPASWFLPVGAPAAKACHSTYTFGLFDTLCSALLLSLLFYALIIKKFNKKPTMNPTENIRTFKVTGMMCAHCQANVQRGLESLEGVNSVIVDLGKSTARIAGSAASEAVIARIRSLGYEAAEIHS